MDGVTDLLLDGVGDTVLYRSLSCFLASCPFTLLARGPFPQSGCGVILRVAMWKMPQANTMVRLDVTLLQVKHSKPDGSPSWITWKSMKGGVRILGLAVAAH